MRDLLLGYLLDALEPEEKRELERRLSTDPDLRRDLELLRRSLEPLDGTSSLIDPPAGLARRTCDWINELSGELAPISDEHRAFPRDSKPADDADHSPSPNEASPASRRNRAQLEPRAAISSRFLASQEFEPSGDSRRRWTFADATVTVGIFVAASLLFFPVVASMRDQSRVALCREKMHRLGVALIDYSRAHGDLFPEVPQSGPLGHAGIYAPRLHQAHLLADAGDVVCPGRSTEPLDHIPTIDELEHADSAALDKLTRTMGGSYGYALGYVENGEYRFARNRNRPTFALLADAPKDHALGSLNHGCGGQNVFYEDGHVSFLNCCKRRELGDDLFANHKGFVGAGIGPDDVVVAASAAAPVIAPVQLERQSRAASHEPTSVFTPGASRN